MTTDEKIGAAEDMLVAFALLHPDGDLEAAIRQAFTDVRAHVARLEQAIEAVRAELQDQPGDDDRLARVLAAYEQQRFRADDAPTAYRCPACDQEPCANRFTHCRGNRL